MVSVSVLGVDGWRLGGGSLGPTDPGMGVVTGGVILWLLARGRVERRLPSQSLSIYYVKIIYKCRSLS